MLEPYRRYVRQKLFQPSPQLTDMLVAEVETKHFNHIIFTDNVDTACFPSFYS